MIRSVTKALARPSLHINTQVPSRVFPSKFHANFSLLSNNGNTNGHTNDYLNKISLTASFSRNFAGKKKVEELVIPSNPSLRGRRMTSVTSDDERRSEKGSDLRFKRVSDEMSIQNSQSFFMKCKELLPDSAIADLVQKIDRFKEKLVTEQTEGQQAKVEESFLKSCERLFDKYNAKELMKYLMKTKVHDLRTKMLNNTVFDFDSQVDIKQKVDKFHQFSSSNSPGSSYERPEYASSDEQINRMLIDKVTKLNLTTNALKKSLDPAEFKRNNAAARASESEEEPEDMIIRAFGDNDGIQDVNFFGEIKGLEGLEDVPSSKTIMNDLEENSEEENITDFMNSGVVSKSEFDVSMAINKTAADMITKSKKDYLKQRFQNDRENIMLYKTQGKEEVIYLQQRGFEKRTVKPTNWIYLYGLQYNIREGEHEDLKESIVAHLEEKVGTVKNIELFSYKDYLDLSETKRKFNISENLEEVFDPLNAQKQDMDGFDVYEHATPVQEKPVKPKKGSIEARLRATENVLKNLQTKANKKLDKSYALIEVQDDQIKKNALSPDVRIFGIHINGKMCMIDDADYKFTVSCHNVHWASSLKDLCSYINQVFQEKNLMDLTLEIPQEFENKLTTKFYVLLRFNSLADTRRAMEALEGSIYQKRTLKFHHLYGSLKLHKGQYTEVIDMDTTAQKHERVNETKLGMIHKISMISRQEEVSDELLDPLGKIEKAIQTYESADREDDSVEERDDSYQVKRIQVREEERWYQSTESMEEDEDRYDHEVQHKGLLFSKG